MQTKIPVIVSEQVTYQVTFNGVSVYTSCFNSTTVKEARKLKKSYPLHDVAIVTHKVITKTTVKKVKLNSKKSKR